MSAPGVKSRRARLPLGGREAHVRPWHPVAGAGPGTAGDEGVDVRVEVQRGTEGLVDGQCNWPWGGAFVTGKIQGLNDFGLALSLEPGPRRQILR